MNKQMNGLINERMLMEQMNMNTMDTAVLEHLGARRPVDLYGRLNISGRRESLLFFVVN